MKNGPWFWNRHWWTPVHGVRQYSCVSNSSLPPSGEVGIDEFWANVEKSDSYPICVQLRRQRSLLLQRTEGRRSSLKENAGHRWEQLWEHNSKIIGKMIESHMKYVNLHVLVVIRVKAETACYIRYTKITVSRRRMQFYDVTRYCTVYSILQIRFWSILSTASFCAAMLDSK